MTSAGDPIHTLVPIRNRQCFWAANGQPGGPVLSFLANTAMTAATDELGGNLFGVAKDATGQEVMVPLGETEWRPG